MEYIMKSKKVIILILTLALITLSLTACSNNDNPPPGTPVDDTAYVRSMSGSLSIERGLQTLDAANGTLVNDRDILRTAANSFARLQLDADRYIEMDELTELHFESSNGGYAWQLIAGEVTVSIDKPMPDGEKFSVSVGESVVEALGTKFTITIIENELYSITHEADKDSSGFILEVHSGSVVLLDLSALKERQEVVVIAMVNAGEKVVQYDFRYPPISYVAYLALLESMAAPGSSLPPESGQPDENTEPLPLDTDITDSFIDEGFLWFVRDAIGKHTGPIFLYDVLDITEVGVAEWGISSLAGIEHLTAITKLFAHQNPLTSVDLSKNTLLREITLHQCQLTSLDLSNNPLLEVLFVYENQLTYLNISNSPLLHFLEARNNFLTTIDLSNNPMLTFLDLHTNQLTSLDVSNNTRLEVLSVFNNKFPSQDKITGTLLDQYSYYGDDWLYFDSDGNYFEYDP